ncbi:hypothetical protein SARC_03525 [Sphaeroforma arctica JP610]|uniref:Cytochrome c oxidase assembly protein COX11, mitochondrial n=1 Tax=Sphaeroforma arctica JP610 TaxID=667725 RepID=A0A0L0G5M9_9EUKA|nr:hypothetical protein SARC_03525 [Sphaeroforma arctica JP610]KNC84254.1 hypothetical protein SARC_03525 [Sphaeroforma arctica JP610]|eukprot:XP_014158156.1 hypothetical protein SARC_03525 [Sphaeroforma arctica JP610]
MVTMFRSQFLNSTGRRMYLNLHRTQPRPITCTAPSIPGTPTPQLQIIQYRKYFTQLIYNTRHVSRSGLRTHVSDQKRYYNQNRGFNQNTASGYYAASIAVIFLAASYAAVPLYRAFCQATGYGGTIQESKDTDMTLMVKHMDRPIRIRFNADTSNNMQWAFKPQQKEVTVIPGESVLAFYTATNPTDKPISGISTYNVIPFEAGQYFNKIQCFCFEEQRLNPDEQVDMPVFFYIDPEFADDPFMAKVNTITLSYTFFESKNFDYEKWSSEQQGPVAIPAHATKGLPAVPVTVSTS